MAMAARAKVTAIRMAGDEEGDGKRLPPLIVSSPLVMPLLRPLVWLVVPLPPLTPLPPICWRLYLSLRHRLLSCLSRASRPAGCCVASPHAAASHLPASTPLIVPSLLVASWHSVPLVGLVVVSPLLTLLRPLCPHLLLSRCCVASPHIVPSPPVLPLLALVRLVVVLPLLTALPPICGHLHLSLCRRLLSYPSPCHCLLHV
jgi:hypothetical protein